MHAQEVLNKQQILQQLFQHNHAPYSKKWFMLKAQTI